MEKPKRRRQEPSYPNASLSSQLGFTYLELVMSMFLILVFVPVIFFSLSHFVMDSQKIMEQERYQMDWLTCAVWIQNEIKKGQRFRVHNEALYFELPTGETIRYFWDRGRIVRQVREQKHQAFRGYTILLQQVKAFRFYPQQSGVWIAFTFQNDYSVRTFIQGRNGSQ